MILHDSTRYYSGCLTSSYPPHLKRHTLRDRIGAKTETVLATLLLEMGSYNALTQ